MKVTSVAVRDVLEHRVTARVPDHEELLAIGLSRDSLRTDALVVVVVKDGVEAGAATADSERAEPSARPEQSGPRLNAGTPTPQTA